MIGVLGASGQLGTAFMKLLKDDAIGVTRSALDLSQPASVAGWFDTHRPRLVINCAAYTGVDAAEQDEATARAVNATAVGILAEQTARLGSAFVTFSTDYVFDGTKDTEYLESDPTGPLNVYGRTKLEGEKLAFQANPDSLVIRTSWVLSGTHRSFASTMIDLISKGPVSVVDDQHGSPTLVDDLAAGAMAAVGRGARGILHMTNHGRTTWFSLAREIAAMSGLDPERVNPIRTKDRPRPARRPTNSVLRSERLTELGLSGLPHYHDSLERAVSQLTTGRNG